MSTLVLGVGLVEALGVDEADSPQAQRVLLGQQVGLAVSQLLVGHQGVVAVAHSHVRLQVGQLLGHLRLLPLQELWTETTGKERGQRRRDRREVEGGVSSIFALIYFKHFYDKNMADDKRKNNFFGSILDGIFKVANVFIFVL